MLFQTCMIDYTPEHKKMTFWRLVLSVQLKSMGSNNKNTGSHWPLMYGKQNKTIFFLFCIQQNKVSHEAWDNMIMNDPFN